MHGLDSALLELGDWQTVGAQAPIGLVPKSRGQGQPAGAVNHDAQGSVVGLRCIESTDTKVVQVVAPVLGDADHLAGCAALGHVNQETVTGFVGQEAEANNLEGFNASQKIG